MDPKVEVDEDDTELKEITEERPLVVENLDEILPYIGELGRYQMGLIFIMSLTILIAGFPVLIMFFAGQNPSWQCVTNSTTCTLNGTFKSGDKHYEDRCSMPRSSWTFTKPKDYSIVTQVFTIEILIFFVYKDYFQMLHCHEFKVGATEVLVS